MGQLTAYALKNGKKLWSFESGKRIVGTPAVSEGIVVFGSADRRIYGLNAKDGSLLWTVEAAEPGARSRDHRRRQSIHRCQ